MFRFLRQFMEQLSTIGAPPEEEHMTTIDSEASLAACLEQSNQAPVFILKHSTRCPVSTSALHEVRAYLEESGESALATYINYVVEARAQSNQLADVLGVPHASPQLFLVSKGKVCWHTSHGGITRKAMATACKKLEESE